MVIKNPKDKGRRWENEAAEILQELIGGEWKRIPGSGAIGTLMREPELTGDIVGKLDYIPKDFKLEAKVGYGGAKQITLKKEWLDKIAEEAEATNSIPAVVLKFSNARKGTRNVIAFDFESFAELMSIMEELYDELVRLYEKGNGIG